MACGIWLLDQGWNPGSLHWEHGVLITGPPGKSPELLLSIMMSIRAEHQTSCELTSSKRLELDSPLLQLHLRQCIGRIPHWRKGVLLYISKGTVKPTSFF